MTTEEVLRDAIEVEEGAARYPQREKHRQDVSKHGPLGGRRRAAVVGITDRRVLRGV